MCLTEAAHCLSTVIVCLFLPMCPLSNECTRAAACRKAYVVVFIDFFLPLHPYSDISKENPVALCCKTVSQDFSVTQSATSNLPSIDRTSTALSTGQSLVMLLTGLKITYRRERRRRKPMVKESRYADWTSSVGGTTKMLEKAQKTKLET